MPLADFPVQAPGSPEALGQEMDVTKPYDFIGFGAMDVTKPYKFIGFGAMDVTGGTPSGYPSLEVGCPSGQLSAFRPQPRTAAYGPCRVHPAVLGHEACMSPYAELRYQLVVGSPPRGSGNLMPRLTGGGLSVRPV